MITKVFIPLAQIPAKAIKDLDFGGARRLQTCREHLHTSYYRSDDYGLVRW